MKLALVKFVLWKVLPIKSDSAKFAPVKSVPVKKVSLITDLEKRVFFKSRSEKLEEPIKHWRKASERNILSHLVKSTPTSLQLSNSTDWNRHPSIFARLKLHPLKRQSEKRELVKSQPVKSHPSNIVLQTVWCLRGISE